MASGWEVERRYLVRVDAAVWGTLGPGHRYQQGYVVTGDPSVRIRLGEPRGPVLAVKSGGGVRRRETEAVVPESMAGALLEASGARVIRKTRWVLGPWELDRFEGPLRGLTLLELELEGEDDPVPEPPPGVVVLREVTDDKRFISSYLAGLTPDVQARLIRQVYQEMERG